MLTHATAGTQAEFPGLERDLNREFVANLKKKAKKITVVEPDKVATWVEGHPKWTDPADAARDFEADIVIFLEIEQFQIQAPGDLNVLQGSAKVHIQAFELAPPKNSKGKPIKDQPKESQRDLRRLPGEHVPDPRARCPWIRGSAGRASRPSSSRSSPPNAPGTSSSTRRTT